MAQTLLRTGVIFTNVVGWGGLNLNFAYVGPPGNICKAIAAGSSSLALTLDGTIIDWGGLGEGIADVGDVPVPKGKGYIAIAQSKDQYWSMALDPIGRIICWGQSTAIPVKIGFLTGTEFTSIESGFTAIAAGGNFGVALRANGTIATWGDNTHGQCDLPSPNSDFIAIGAGQFHWVGLKSDGSIVCGGFILGGDITPPTGTDFVAISAGHRHCLALKTDGSVVGWGINASGEIDCPTSKNFVAIAAGQFFSVGLKKNGSIMCWGMGYGSTIKPPTGTFISLVAGVGYNYALKADDSCAEWGSQSSLLRCHYSLGGVSAIALGGAHGLAISTYDNSIECWGDNTYGQAPDPPPVGSFKAISAGKRYSMALLLVDGLTTNLAVWGDDSCYQVTDKPSGYFTSIAAGAYHCLAIMVAGNIRGWGNNDAGQVSPLPDGYNFTKVAAGDVHSVALRSDTTLIAWGGNSFGQTNYPAGGGFADIAAGRHHTIALKADRSLVGWGDNSSGQIDCPTGNNFIAIAAAGDTSMAIKCVGGVTTIIIWGDASYNQTGPPGNNYKAIAAGSSSSGPSLALAIKSIVRAKTIGSDYLPVTVNLTTNTLTAIGTQFTNNERVRLTNVGGALPSGLSPRTTYYVRNVSGTYGWAFQLAATFGGTPITLTDAGTGNHYITSIQRRPIMRCAKCINYSGSIKITFCGITLKDSWPNMPTPKPDPNKTFVVPIADTDYYGPNDFLFATYPPVADEGDGWIVWFTVGNHNTEIGEGQHGIGLCGQLILSRLNWEGEDGIRHSVDGRQGQNIHHVCHLVSAVHQLKAVKAVDNTR